MRARNTRLKNTATNTNVLPVQSVVELAPNIDEQIDVTSNIRREALNQLRVKLLDFSSRNQLINFKHRVGKSLQFTEGHPAAIYQRLIGSNNNSSIRILGLPDPSEGDLIERNGRHQRPDPSDWALSNGISNKFDIPDAAANLNVSDLRALMYSDDLAKHCRKIDHAATLAIEETGANMLFLVLGFLEMPDQSESDRTLKAPLICIPVSLERKPDGSGNMQFSLKYTGEDISENLSLRHKLYNDFGLSLPELSRDEINVGDYLTAIKSVIGGRPKFALKQNVSLCLLSFSNVLLVRDLDPNQWPQNGESNILIDHPIVREVLEGRPDQGGVGLNVVEEHLVEDGPGATIPLVYDADSSQHSALIDILALNKNLVIMGPPGTGKSQTITNLIAASIAAGKKVLFVAEKLAALEVVKNRLALAGLDPFLLELHSNKTNKKKVLEEITKRVEFRPQPQANLPHMLTRLENHRTKLKAYSDLLNTITLNDLGLTLHQIMWRTEKYRQCVRSDTVIEHRFSIADATQLTALDFDRRMDCLVHLGAQYKIIGDFDPNCAFWGFYPDPLIPGDEIKIASFFEVAIIWGKRLVDAAMTLSKLLGGHVQNITQDTCCAQLTEIRCLIETVDPSLPLQLLPRFFADDETGAKAAQALEEFARHVAQFHQLEVPVKNALRKESSVTKANAESLIELHRLGESLGAELGSIDDLRSLHKNLVASASNLSNTHADLVQNLSQKNVPYDGSQQNLLKILHLIDLVMDVPEDKLHFQTPNLMVDGAVHAIEQLLDLQSEWTAIENELNISLYVDSIPSEGEIKQAISILREGDSWYRVFQGRWRKSVALHKRLQRSKTKLPVHKRLEQLEQIFKMMRLKAHWNALPNWVHFIGFPSHAIPAPLESYLALARWNREIKIAMEDVHTEFIDPLAFTATQARTLRREFVTTKNLTMEALAGIESINKRLRRLSEAGGSHLVDKVIEKTREFAESLNAAAAWLEIEAQPDATFSQVLAGCKAVQDRANLKSQVQSNEHVKSILGDLFQDVDTDCSGALAALAFGQSIDKVNLPQQGKNMLRAKHPVESCLSLIDTLENVSTGLKQVDNLSNNLGKYGDFDLEAWTGSRAEVNFDVFAEALYNKIQKAFSNMNLLHSWTLYLSRKKQALELKLQHFVTLLGSKDVKPEELSDAYAYCTYSTITQRAFLTFPLLLEFNGRDHDDIRREYQQLDKQIIGLRGKAIAQECASMANAQLPSGRSGSRVEDRTEMALLEHLMPQQRPRMPLRQILSRAGNSIQVLKPCFMMGPQAVAQYLDPGAIKFDLIIMDEASQMKPEEAIGSIARGNQLVVVGDPNQLPPTSFFSRMSTDDSGEDNNFVTSDSESILDVCSVQFRNTRALRWHYRSQHHSLIAFSNRNFYKGNLVIFPSPYGQGGKLGVRAVYLADAIYENQTNLREARRVVDAVIEHISTRPQESMGIVTLNSKQRDLIAELLEERLRFAQGADEYRERWANEGHPLFIKNLENVQGDERDAIIISTTFGKSKGATVVRQNFGPISRQGGWRRLNVLFTRAKRSIAIYTSLRPEDIVMDANTPDGTKALRNYLEYARSGSLTIVEETGREPDSDFEISVIDMLKKHGYEVTPQLGVAGFRIDIAVKHPEAAGSYLAAIECDGASYHSALSVRDRDRIRQEILESLGWRGRIWRIWSTDWFRTPREESAKLISFLENLRNTWTPEYGASETWIEEQKAQDPQDN